MKKNMTLISPFVLSMIAMTSFSATTLAAENGSVTSEATIKAIAGGDTPVSPVDPTNPKDPNKPGPTDPDEGNTTNQTGPLQINYLSNLNFGDDIAITSRTVTANVKNETPRFFQVSDLRGTAGGWELAVTLGDFKPTNSDSTVTAIKGAEIKFQGGEAVSSNDTDEDAAVTHGITLSAGGNSGSQTIMSADKGTGRGTWLARYTAKSGASDNDKIVFSAPTNSITANTNYQATLTWQLVDGAK